MSNELFFTPIILLAAFGTSIWNGLLKSSGDRAVFATLMVIPQLIVSGIFICFLPLPNLQIALILFFGSMIHDAYIIFLGYAYKEGDLSLVFPVAAGSAPVLALLYWHVLAQAPISNGKVFAVLFISLGIMSLPFTAHTHIKKKSFIYALVTAFFIAAYAITDTYGLRLIHSAPSYIAWLFFIKGWILLITMLFLGRMKRQDFQSQIPSYFLAGLLAAFSYTIALWSFQYLETAVVLSLRSTSILFSLAVAIIALKEPFSWLKIALCCMITVGVFIILLQ
jgi:drug/metabolite transporter (DMT)-like permease